MVFISIVFHRFSFTFQGAFIANTRPVPTKHFGNGDGFDVYVDAGRFFPESTVFAKVKFQNNSYSLEWKSW